MKASRPEGSGRGWTSGVSWPSMCTSSRVRHLRDVRLDAWLFVEDLGESGHGGERGTRLVGDGCDEVVALFLDDFSGFSDGDTWASDDQLADGSGGGLDAGGLSAEFAEGDGEEDSDGGVGGHHRPDSTGTVGLLRAARPTSHRPSGECQAQAPGDRPARHFQDNRSGVNRFVSQATPENRTRLWNRPATHRGNQAPRASPVSLPAGSARVLRCGVAAGTRDYGCVDAIRLCSGGSDVVVANVLSRRRDALMCQLVGTLGSLLFVRGDLE